MDDNEREQININDGNNGLLVNLLYSLSLNSNSMIKDFTLLKQNILNKR